MELKISWKGIVVTTHFDDKSENYLLKLKPFSTHKYVLIDRDDNELISIDSDFQWKKMGLDYDISTSHQFDELQRKELFLFAILHGINYYKSLVAIATT